MFGFCGVRFIPFTCSAFIMAIIAILFKRLQLWAVCTFFFNGYEGDETKNTEQKGSRRQKERKRGTRHNQNACRMVSHPKHTHHSNCVLCTMLLFHFEINGTHSTRSMNTYNMHIATMIWTNTIPHATHIIALRNDARVCVQSKVVLYTECSNGIWRICSRTTALMRKRRKCPQLIYS